MRFHFSIPLTALIALLVNTGDSIATLTSNRSPLSIPSKRLSFNSNSDSYFTCNEPFMIPAEYIDEKGNSFAMCFSDPRFHHKNIIWYIQGMSGSFKAVGVAHNIGNQEFVGTVVPIEQPSDLSGMHADPVAVTVRLDRIAGVISVDPNETTGKLINWIIRPNGFPSGSLKVPKSCGPFIEPFENGNLLAPLTGATHKSTVCVIPSSKGDAFISWGHYKHPDDDKRDITLDDGYAHKFFSVGFVGADRGVSIDICDPGNGDANRCEMSRLVGHTRKTFIVGTEKDADAGKDLVKPGRGHDLPRRHEHEIRSDALINRIDLIERNIKSILVGSKAKNVVRRTRRRRDEKIDRPIEEVEPLRHPRRRHSRSKDLFQCPSQKLGHKRDFLSKGSPAKHRRHDYPTETSDDENILNRNIHKIHRPNRRDEIISDPVDPMEKSRRRHIRDELIDRPIEKYRRKRADRLVDRPAEIIRGDNYCPLYGAARVNRPVKRARKVAVVADPAPVARRHDKNCPVHPLLHPHRPVASEVNSPSPAIPPPVLKSAPVINPNIYHLEADTFSHYNRLHARLNRLDHRLDDAENIIANHLVAFKNWLSQQQAAMEDRGRDFIDFLAALKADVVYSPPKSKKKRNFFRKIGKSIRKVSKSAGNIVESTGDSVKKTAVKVKHVVADPAADLVKDTAATTGHVLNKTVATGGNVLHDTAHTAKNVAKSPLSSVGKDPVDPAKHAVTAKTVKHVADTPVVDPATPRQIAPARALTVSDRFDLNDDLLPPARAAMVSGPNQGVDPLGPVGPVIPPPAIRTFERNRNSDPVRDAIDYLN